MEDLNNIYNDVIMDHYLLSPNKRDLKDYTCCMKGTNPSCGDEIEIKVKINNDIIEDMAFLGKGCAISISSTSILIDLVKGKNVKEAISLIENFIKMIDKDKNFDIDILEDACVFESISNLPARKKCATLAYRTLEKIINETNK